MPAAIKRQKISATKKAPSTRGGLNTFTKVSKASGIAKTIIDKNDSLDVDVAITGTDSYEVIGRKRRLVVESDESSSPDPPTSSRDSTRSIKTLPSRKTTPQTPQRAIINRSSPTIADTPTKGARALLNSFQLNGTPTKSPVAFHSSSSGLIASTPQKTLSPIDARPNLPTELLDLVNLHSSFLTALSMHYAHNGTHTPADLRNLFPAVARAWGRRDVTLEDVRRTIGVMNSRIDPDSKDNRMSRLSLSDYSQGKICIEMRETTGKTGRIARPVNEDLLNEIYQRALLTAWEQTEEATKLEDFIKGLPLEPISTCSSVLKISPLLAKGQRRLEDMKAVMTLKKETAAANKAKLLAPTSTTFTSTTTQAGAPRPSLLERLRAKAIENAKAPPPPTSAEMARNQALHRVEEVASVLSILSTSSSLGQQRVSFTMGTVLGKLKDSFKTPISKAEAEASVRLLVGEIAPAWMKIVRIGKADALVIDREGKPTEAEIRERVEKVLG